MADTTTGEVTATYVAAHRAFIAADAAYRAALLSDDSGPDVCYRLMQALVTARRERDAARCAWIYSRD